MIYLDSSALLKLLFQEQESDALELWLSQRLAVPKLSSELAKVEVLRSCRRLRRASLPAAELLVSQIDLVPLAGAVVDQASRLEGDSLRSLDALHLATALSLGSDLSSFVAYDHRLTMAAQDVGLPVVSPAS